MIFSQWIFFYGASRVLCFAGIHFELLWLSGTSKRMRNTQRRIYSPTKLTFKHSWIQLRSSLDKHMITFSPFPFTFSPLSPLFLHFLFFPFPFLFLFRQKLILIFFYLSHMHCFLANWWEQLITDRSACWGQNLFLAKLNRLRDQRSCSLKAETRYSWTRC